MIFLLPILLGLSDYNYVMDRGIVATGDIQRALDFRIFAIIKNIILLMVLANFQLETGLLLKAEVGWIGDFINAIY